MMSEITLRIRIFLYLRQIMQRTSISCLLQCTEECGVVVPKKARDMTCVAALQAALANGSWMDCGQRALL